MQPHHVVFHPVGAIIVLLGLFYSGILDPGSTHSIFALFAHLMQDPTFHTVVNGVNHAAQTIQNSPTLQK